MPAKLKSRPSNDFKLKFASSGKPLHNGHDVLLKTRKSNAKTDAAFRNPDPTAQVEDEEEEDEIHEGAQKEGNEEETGHEDLEDSEEDDGVNEEGMKRLMKALGEDGLDDVGRMQLDALGGEETDSSGTGENDGEEEDYSEPDSGQDGKEGEVDEDKPDDSEAEGTTDNEEEEEEEGVALEDAESVDEDAVPRQKIVTSNKVALERIRETIKLDPSLPWTDTLTITYPEIINVGVDDDLNRELAFYKQALHGANTARSLASSHNLPFSRPPDYFAEMVKSDAHMERIRQRLLDESASLKRAEEKRREGEGKKYGKQVQLEKLKERERRKKEMEERLKGLKRKHKDALIDTQAGDEAFDVAVEDAISDRPRPSKRSKVSSPPKQSHPNSKQKLSRKARDSKFGFGGKGRRDKQNTRASTEKFGSAPSGSRKGTKGLGKPAKPKRLGKSRRLATRKR